MTIMIKSSNATIPSNAPIQAIESDELSDDVFKSVLSFWFSKIIVSY